MSSAGPGDRRVRSLRGSRRRSRVWWITPWFMLQREVRLRVLLPTGIITGLASIVYTLSASLWMPRTVTENQRQFGFFGVALALVTWLTGTAAHHRASVPASVRCWPKTKAPSASSSAVPTPPARLAPGARPSLAEPTTAPTFLQALGRRGGDDEDDDVTDARTRSAPATGVSTWRRYRADGERRSSCARPPARARTRRRDPSGRGCRAAPGVRCRREARDRR